MGQERKTNRRTTRPQVSPSELIRALQNASWEEKEQIRTLIDAYTVVKQGDDPAVATGRDKVLLVTAG